MALRNKRILITRPQHQTEQWRRALLDAGALVDSIPMLAIEPICSGPPLHAIKNQILDFDQVAYAIFVSQNAVRFGFEWLWDYWPQLPQGPRYYAIGTATARALSNQGVHCERGANAMDSAELLSLPGLQQVEDQRVLVFRGCGGRTKIGAALRKRGARVDYCELYRRTLPEDAEGNLRRYRHQPDAVTVHSGETLENFASCARLAGTRHLFAVPLICPSARVAALARDLGFSRVIEAQNAGDTAMLAALAQL
ncbi:uroporphyrinogen-III synthase [Microbulbifer sp. TYP-18]|uniref:uroporphyrinogen-III synthase n=1 Tax=Microbulbifer sp. TYP-18 TaxID=3230024 RepID=UPI0034C68DFF